ncbi:MAG: hypothetical protein QXG46_06005 [Ignisphaera sp.]
MKKTPEAEVAYHDLDMFLNLVSRKDKAQLRFEVSLNAVLP